MVKAFGILVLSVSFFISKGQAVTFTSSNLPIIVINTNGAVIQDEPKIVASMGIIDNGLGNRNAVTDPFNNFSGKIGIEIRGSSSQMFPKKQYGLELQDDQGDGINASLLGMPAEEDWILFAPYNDKALMRDALAYKLGRSLGHYAPRTRYCEVLINNEYMGIYVLIEKIKRDKNRLNIAKLSAEEVSGDDLTGGYILKVDKATGNGGESFQSKYPPANRSAAQQISFLYDYPKYDAMPQAQKEYINQYVAKFEDALAGVNYRDPVNGYVKYIDVASFIDFLIVNEVSKNVDGYRLSTYLHKQRESDGGKLHLGPIWDFNLGFGNADYCTRGNPEGFVLDFNTTCPDDFWLIPFWWKRLFQDGNFTNALNQRWTTLRTNELQTETIITYIDSVATVLNAESQQRNFQRWPVLGTYVWPNYYVGSSFQDEVNWLKNWVTKRMTWLDKNLPMVVTGAEDEQTLEDVHVYPNPFSNSITIELTILKPSEVRVQLVNSLGKKVLSYTDYAAGTYIATLKTEQLAQGVYIYSVWIGNRSVELGKLVK